MRAAGAARNRVRPVLAAILLVSAGGAGASDAGLRALVAPYLEARERGEVGYVEGAAYAEPRAVTAPPVPWEGVSVMLLPHSADLEAELDAIKESLRDSVAGYVAASHRLIAAREGYERSLAATGGGELVRGEVSDGLGRFRFTAMPAGRWLLLAWREVPHVGSTRKIPGADASSFRDNWERTGHAAVGYWRLDVEVRPGETASVSLFDRNGWMTVVREELRLPADAPKAGTPRRRQGTTR